MTYKKRDTNFFFHKLAAHKETFSWTWNEVGRRVQSVIPAEYRAGNERVSIGWNEYARRWKFMVPKVAFFHLIWPAGKNFSRSSRVINLRRPLIILFVCINKWGALVDLMRWLRSCLVLIKYFFPVIFSFY